MCFDVEPNARNEVLAYGHLFKPEDVRLPTPNPFWSQTIACREAQAQGVPLGGFCARLIR